MVRWIPRLRISRCRHRRRPACRPGGRDLGGERLPDRPRRNVAATRALGEIIGHHRVQRLHSLLEPDLLRLLHHELSAFDRIAIEPATRIAFKVAL